MLELGRPASKDRVSLVALVKSTVETVGVLFNKIIVNLFYIKYIHIQLKTILFFSITTSVSPQTKSSHFDEDFYNLRLKLFWISYYIDNDNEYNVFNEFQINCIFELVFFLY